MTPRPAPFYKRLAHCCALLLTFLSPLVIARENTLKGDTLHHGDLRLSVTKPAEWRYQTPKEKRDARRANTYLNKLYDSEVKLEPFPPRIIISKYPEPHRGLNPHVSIDRYPLDDLRFKTSAWLAGRVIVYRQYLFDRVEIAEPLQNTVLDGKSAATFRLRYVLEVKNGPPQHVDEHVWVVATGITAYLITARCSQDGPNANVAEIYSVLGSLIFD